jgi:hypothetical protein
MPRHCLFRLTLFCLAALVIGSPLTGKDKEDKVVRPFNGKNLTGWAFKGDKANSKWVVGMATLDEKDPAKLAVQAVDTDDKEIPASKRQLINASTSVDLYTEQKFGDCTIELEFMIPKGSNSGVYIMGEYEIQILDSYGKEKVGSGDMGGLYGAASPKVNACKKPGEWQKFVIHFKAPRFKEGKKISEAKFIKITLNDKVIHDNVEMNSQTPGVLTGKEVPIGPLMFQGNHGPVAFRAIKITPTD